jgi:hypothetical protein
MLEVMGYHSTVIGIAVSTRQRGYPVRVLLIDPTLILLDHISHTPAEQAAS